MASAYRVYPQPPPTANNLSPRQKAHLRRSSTKLTKVLGAAPQIVDSIPRNSRSALANAQLSTNPKQPSLAIESSRRNVVHRRVKTADGRMMADQTSLHDARMGDRSQRFSTDSVSRVGAKIHKGRPSSSDSTQTRSFSVDYSMNSRGLRRVDTHMSAPPAPRPRPAKDTDASSTYSRDSLCDSLYEPTFDIPSPITARREKMARVCKLLGDGVPVELVFPYNQYDQVDAVPNIPEASVSRGDSVLDVRPSSVSSLASSLATMIAEDDFILASRIADKPLPKRPSFRESAQSSRTLAPIRERTSLLSTSDVDSASDSDSPGLTHGSSVESLFSSANSDETPSSPVSPRTSLPEPASPFAVAYESRHVRQALSSPDARREFALYVPLNPNRTTLRRRSSGGDATIVRTKRGSQDLTFEIVRGVADVQL